MKKGKGMKRPVSTEGSGNSIARMKYACGCGIGLKNPYDCLLLFMSSMISLCILYLGCANMEIREDACLQ